VLEQLNISVNFCWHCSSADADFWDQSCQWF